MEILVLLIVVAVVAAAAFAAVRQREPVGATWPRRDPTARAVVERSRATEPAAVAAAASRLHADAREATAGGQGDAFAPPAPYGVPRAIDDEDASVACGSPLAEDSHALEARWRAARDADPMDDPRYADPRYDGRLAGDYRGAGRSRALRQRA